MSRKATDINIKNTQRYMSKQIVSTKSILVTGATGFIFVGACPQFVKHGYQVRDLPNAPPVDFPCSIDWHQIANIDSSTDWSTILTEVDYVIHLAALAHQLGIHSEGRFDEFMEVNAAGTKRLAEAVRVSSTVKRLIFISSIGAVKSLSDYAISEESLCEPDTDYGKSKLAAEEAIKATLQDSAVDWCILRRPLSMVLAIRAGGYWPVS